MDNLVQLDNNLQLALLEIMMLLQSMIFPFILFTSTTLLFLPIILALSNSNIHSSSSSPKMSTPNNNNNSSNKNNEKRQRHITFVRHGRTYMNEYLATPGSQWGDSEFTDIFTDLLPTEEINHKYRDSILSPHGITQAKEMSKRLLSKTKKESSDEVRENSLSDVDLIITSPLTRTIQTTELGLLPFFEQQQQQKENLPKIIASPLATERVYLISDLGQPISELKQKYPWIDFETGFNTCSGTTMTTHDPEKWWFTCDDEGSEENNTAAYYTYYDIKNTNNNNEEDEEAPSMVRKTYKEWRPSSENQKYFCLGEPDDYFEARMYSLVQFITSLTATHHYQNVVLVCHWGVIDYLIGQDFQNCQVQTFDLEDVVSYLKKKNT